MNVVKILLALSLFVLMPSVFAEDSAAAGEIANFGINFTLTVANLAKVIGAIILCFFGLSASVMILRLYNAKLWKTFAGGIEVGPDSGNSSGKKAKG